ncbi:MAG: hypothetical protein WCG52_11575 [bacterium]
MESHFSKRIAKFSVRNGSQYPMASAPRELAIPEPMKLTPFQPSRTRIRRLILKKITEKRGNSVTFLQATKPPFKSLAWKHAIHL